MQSSPYLLPLLGVALLAIFLCVVIWQRRQAPGAIPLAFLMISVTIWSLAYMFSLAATTLPVMLFWANMAFLGIVLAPASWVVFALHYSDQSAWLTPRRLLLLTIMPVFTLVAAWTNELHHGFRTAVYLVDMGSSVVLEATLGPLFWLHTGYSYMLLLTGTILLLRSLYRLSPSYRTQAGGLLIGIFAPWIGNIIYLSGLSPFPHLDLTPFALGITGVALTWDMLRFGLLDLMPIAHSAVFRSIEGGVIVLDSQARVVDANPAGLALIGQPAPEVLGQPAAVVFARWPEALDRYRGVSEAHEELVVGVAADLRAFDVRISPIYDQRGRLNGRVLLLHDITERRRAALELQRRNDELTALAHENARLYSAVQQELAERKQAEVSLSLAKEAAEVANRAKTRFLGNMSHELRTPLTAILGYADLLAVQAARLGDPMLLADIERIRVAGRHLLDLISDVLDITRIEAEKLDLNLEPLDIAALVRSLVDTAMPLVAKNGNRLEVVCPPDIGTMYADITRVRQILLNVLGNAAKFTEQGEITVRVCAHQDAASGADTVVFQIRDTGIGMPPDQQEQLFKEFVQVDDSPTRKYGGSGLGLAISYRLCKLMGGEIAVLSAPGAGSTFSITLPRRM